VEDGGVLVVAGGDAAPGLELVVGALDDVATPVGRAVIANPSGAGRAALAAMRGLVGRFEDDRGDPSAAQVGAVAAGGVGLVGDDRIRAGPRPSRPGARHADGGQQRREHRRVAALTGSNQHRHLGPGVRTHAVSVACRCPARRPDRIAPPRRSLLRGRPTVRRPEGPLPGNRPTRARGSDHRHPTTPRHTPIRALPHQCDSASPDERSISSPHGSTIGLGLLELCLGFLPEDPDAAADRHDRSRPATSDPDTTFLSTLGLAPLRAPAVRGAREVLVPSVEGA
jgi:hypothetical protein